MKANLKWVPKTTGLNIRHRRSSSTSLSKKRRSVHWISPSVFGKSVEKEAKKSQTVTLEEVLQASSSIPVNVERRRRFDEVNKDAGEAKYKAKRIKREGYNEDRVFIKKSKQVKEHPVRLSYILNNDPYNVLEIAPGATNSIIKKTYRRRAIETHPDKGGSKEDFIRVKTAYDILSDAR
eukprot:TRINITY_DN8622_c0_g1_i3.p1 TRINITY_DN8622_c0_g1~~TRINITY_DN8622_c0_g1_i3.p1  ORF type:complete len:179 (+),score=36.90 TRINITY_DN8622_c0_g1_i3:126-662(+)